MIFQDKPRTDSRDKQYSESDYEYLNRSDWDESECIRKTLSSWFERYPDHEKPDLISRISSKDNYQHYSATFELYLHELFINLGYEIEAHPETNNCKSTRPDFLVTDPEGFSFYVEAVQSSDIKKHERSGENRLNIVFDSVNKITSHDYFLEIDYEGLPPSPPSGKKLRSGLEAWLNTLDYNEVCRELKDDDYTKLPQYTFMHEGWKAIFTVIPRSEENRGTPLDGVIGMLSPGARWLSTWETIRDTLVAKGKHYGELNLPLLIAVNANVFHLDRISIMEALFGQEQFIFNRVSNTDGPEMRRSPNGLWYGPKGIRYKRVSGILIGFDIKPWTYGVREMTLYINPWAYNSLEGSIFSMPYAKLHEGKMKWNQGMHPKEILHLKTPYPGIEY